jgi:hypothetical protein
MLLAALLFSAVNATETPSKSVSCFVIRTAVERFGEVAVVNEARARGLSEERIQAEAVRCLGRRV